MVKYIPLTILAAAVVAVLVAAPRKPDPEGFSSYKAEGEYFWAIGGPGRADKWRLDSQLRVAYAVTGAPGETYAVELWLEQPPKFDPKSGEMYQKAQWFLFDVQSVKVPAGDGPRTVRGKFHRREWDRFGLEEDYKPGKMELTRFRTNYRQREPADHWNCKLVVRRGDKVVKETDPFRVGVILRI